jgi:hypothetical protein
MIIEKVCIKEEDWTGPAVFASLHPRNETTTATHVTGPAVLEQIWMLGFQESFKLGLAIP